jgi:DUF1680 family protein
MAVLLGYVDLYRLTGEKEFLDTAVKAWERILADHVNVAGGPWSYQVKNTTNQECFAAPQYFHPTNCVETCSTTTWIQLCLSLFDLTGEARYADAAEVAMLNQLLGAQSPNGKDWAYHSMLNMPERGFEDEITCCASSGPRALELYARHLMGVAKERLVVNSFLSSVVPLNGANGLSGRVVIEGESMEIDIDGTRLAPEKTAEGFYRVRREWKAGDRVALKFAFPLRAHFQTASDGVRWVAFSWGPLALAQSLVKQTDYPQNVLFLEKESEDGKMWLDREPAGEKARLPAGNAIEELDTNRASDVAATRAALPAWRLKTPRKIVMVPYFQAGAEGGGVRTMFPTRPSL